MKKRILFLVCLLLPWCFILLTGMATLDKSATESVTVVSEEDGILRVGTCPKCFSGYHSICAGNYKLVDQGEHTYSFVKKCYAYYYEANHDFLCLCGDSFYGVIGQHECYEKHTACSLKNRDGGIYNVCFCDIQSR